jgi:hypothetical protein
VNDFGAVPSYEQYQAAQNEIRLWVAIFSMFWGAVSGFIGSKRGGNGFLWFVIGAILGPFALPLPFLFAGVAVHSVANG